MGSLSINNLSVGYLKKCIINNLNIENIPRGKVTVLLGPNGCGKSTLMRGLAGLGSASGKLYLDETDLMSLPLNERAEKVVYLPQSIPSGIHLHVFESVIVAARATGSSEYATEERVMETLRRLGIEHLAFSYLDELSGGQKQLVGLAQCLIRKPDLLLLDEPLSALDLNYQYHVMDQVKRATKKRNIITIVVVHDINIALRHADYVIMLKGGEHIASGTPCSVITPQNLAKVYGVRGRVECCSSGMSQVIIDGIVNQQESEDPMSMCELRYAG